MFAGRTRHHSGTFAQEGTLGLALGRLSARSRLSRRAAFVRCYGRCLVLQLGVRGARESRSDSWSDRVLASGAKWIISGRHNQFDAEGRLASQMHIYLAQSATCAYLCIGGLSGSSPRGPFSSRSGICANKKIGESERVPRRAS